MVKTTFVKEYDSQIRIHQFWVLDLRGQKIPTAFHSPQEEVSPSSRRTEQMCSKNASPQAEGVHTALPVKLPWGFLSNQGPRSLSFTDLGPHSELPMGKSSRQQDIALAERVVSSEKHEWQTLWSISSVLPLEFKRLWGFWATTGRADPLPQDVFTECFQGVHCPPHNHCSVTFPGPRMFPQCWCCSSSSTSGTPDKAQDWYLPIDWVCYS